MGHEIDLKRYDIRTDLVIDTIDNNDDNIDTLVEVQGDIKITKVTVDDNVSRIIGKKKGYMILNQIKEKYFQLILHHQRLMVKSI